MTTLEEAAEMVARAEAILKVAQDKLAQAQAEAEAKGLNPPKAPAENYVKFTKYFGYRQYHYAAIRVNGLWYITGRRASDSEANAVLWPKLMEWLVKDASNVDLQALSYKSITVMEASK